METGEQLLIQMQVLRNDVDVALGALMETQQRLEAVIQCLLAERRGETTPVEIDRCLAALRAAAGTSASLK